MIASAATATLIHSNWQHVCDEVAEACEQANRPVGEVQVVGVSKYVGPELTYQLMQAGCTVLGENRPQQLWEKQQWMEEHAAEGTEYEWHMIGHLQRNKSRRTVPMIRCLHSLDSLRLAESVNEVASLSGQPLDVLLEVNVSQETSKTGANVEALDEVVAKLPELKCLKLRGLMAMSALNADSAQARREFSRVRELRDRLASEHPDFDWSQLSMGMSGDFREAILEGSTLVRVGSSLWRGIL